ncbi:MAG: ATP-dependent 6-phosphofructokinase [Desulfuromonadaceae bacterium]|nr:ATP-dependent 6-phosphofructokinase [Desulfuromonadaceae bacterium]
MSNTLAILTGGGDCPGLNAVIRGVVRSAVGLHNWRVLGIEDGFEGLIGKLRTRDLTLDSVSGILPRGGTILGTSNRGNPFSYPVTVNGKIELQDISDSVLQEFQKSGAEVLIAVGGDGTLKIAQGLYEKGLPVIGIPKTIDNDLRATDVTFGYRTAVAIVTEALDRLHSTAESHHRVMVVEVMGRDAGWIALESGIAGSADVILIPEIPYSVDRICAAIEQRRGRGRRFSIVVVAEGAVAAEGNKVLLQTAAENLGVERLGGIGHAVAQQITAQLDMESRVVTLGHLQRGGSPTPYDRILASRFGVKAVELIAQKKFGRMVALRGRQVVDVEIVSAISQLNLVDPAGELVATAESLGIMVGR